MAGRGGKNPKISRKDSCPQDLLLSILATLPVKSLSRFKCVSKHWRSLITAPDFIEQHLETQQSKEYPQFIFASVGSKSDIVLESVEIVDVEVGRGEGVKTRKSFERSSLNICHLSPDCYSVSNPCDGNLCFFGETNVLVYNPGTREFRLLRMEKKASSRGRGSYRQDCFGQGFSNYHIVGFGRDQVTKESKIIRLFIPEGKQVNHIHECEVFTLNSEAGASWRGIGEVPYFIREGQQPVYVNGALHWILDNRHANPSELITYFDLHTEKFQVISYPACFSEVSDRDRWHFGLLYLRSSLCLVKSGFMLQQLNIWIMNQSNGVWEKLFDIDFGLRLYRIPLPLAELKDGTFFVSCPGDCLQIYDPESKSFSEVLLQHERRVTSYALFESLVPLYGEALMY